MRQAHEINFDGLVGPTHNHSGLSPGNLASIAHAGAVAHPRAAALEGLEKMRLLLRLGLRQGVLPPHERPDVGALRRFGFEGTDAQVLRSAARRAPRLLAACSSASSMWAANAATVAPSADTADGKVHLTPANLISTLHRSLEPPVTSRLLRAIFRGERFVHHPPVPGGAAMADEGAANHTRLAPTHGEPGLHLFVYGREWADRVPPSRLPARQSLEASQAVARLHRLPEERLLFLRQSPRAIDAGAFHADLVCVGNEHVLFHHAQAFAGGGETVARIAERFAGLTGRELLALTVPADQVSLADALASYVFNGQLVTLPGGGMALIAPCESREVPSVSAYLDALVADPSSPIRAVHVVATRHSMRNGGGPACLRLRLVLTEEELAGVAPGVLVDERLLDLLTRWVTRHHRDRLEAADLADPALLDESRTALDELTRLLGLGPVYDFQR